MSSIIKILIFIITFLITSNILKDSKWLISNDPINYVSTFIDQQIKNKFIPSFTPTLNEFSTNFSLSETVPIDTTIIINNFTSMGQINQALKFAFQQKFLETIVYTDAKSSDLGIQDLLARKIDIAAISRPLTTSEKQQDLVAIPITQDTCVQRIVPIDGLTPKAASEPDQCTLYYVYKQPANPAVKGFLGYVTSPQAKQIIKNAQLNLKDPEMAKLEFSQKKENITQTQNNVKNINAQTPLKKKQIRGIYLSRYQITNNADEKMIRERVRYYHSQGINTIIHGVWGNGCTMYNSEVMQQTLGYKSCPNQFRDQWLNWLIDEAHQQGMEVHAYFEKGIKIDKNSPIFDLAISRKWLVPGVDKTYSEIEHYVLDVEVPEVADLFKNILVEFVQKYPTIDAVQWDDYLGYHAELPGKVDRTQKLTNFVQRMITSMKKANSSVSFDICHHNPYWAKKYFAADWKKWGVNRVFIQAYNEKNFNDELIYAQEYDGIAITDYQLHHLKELANNPKIKSILVFPFSGKPEETAANLKNFNE